MQYTRTLSQNYYEDHDYEKGHVDASQWVNEEIYDDYDDNIHGLETKLASQPVYLGLLVDGIGRTAKERKQGHDIEVDSTDL